MKKIYSATVLLSLVFGISACVTSKPVVNTLPEAPQTQPNRMPKTVLFQAMGDLNLDGSADRLLPEKGYSYAFSGTQALLDEGDVNFVNLESPITDRGEPHPKTFTFRMRPQSYPFIQKAGINLFSIANNHSMDYGAEGILQTIQILRDGGSHFAGAGANLREARTPAVFAARQVQVGFLAYSLTHPEEFYATAERAGTAFGHLAYVKEDIAKLRPKVELLVVSFHWGAELTTDPKPYQKELAHAALDAGADMVLGHHPHVVQPVERYKHGVIFYSLGNYSFGSYSNQVVWGMFARTKWNAENGKRAVLESVEIIPLNINNFQVDFRPVPLTGDVATQVLTEFEAQSAPFGSRFVRRVDRTELVLDDTHP